MNIPLAWGGSVAATGYNLYYGTTPGSRDNVVRLGNVLTTILDLWSPAKWFLMVTATAPAGESQPSNIISVVIDPPAPKIELKTPAGRTLRITRRVGDTSKLVYLTVNKSDEVIFNGTKQ